MAWAIEDRQGWDEGHGHAHPTDQTTGYEEEVARGGVAVCKHAEQK